MNIPAKNAELFDTLDPSPFHEKALSCDAEGYIVGYAGEYGGAEPVRLIVRALGTIKQHAAEVISAIHAHFQFAYDQCRRQYQRRMRIGRTLLVVGVAVLVIALLLRALLGVSWRSPDARSYWRRIVESRMGCDVAPGRDFAV